jgi:HAD superfamily hydrolase (TIGR01509 family)
LLWPPTTDPVTWVFVKNAKPEGKNRVLKIILEKLGGIPRNRDGKNAAAGKRRPRPSLEFFSRLRWGLFYYLLLQFMIKAIIFDMNGVIVDDEELHEIAFRRVLARLGIKFTKEDFKQMCLGRTDKEGFEKLKEAYNLKENLEDLLKDKLQIYLSLVDGNIKSFPGVIELINRLKNDYTLALVTGAIRQDADLILNHFGIKNDFSVIITGDDISKSKPDPEPYLQVIKELGVSASDCLVIEDSLAGVRSAKSAGIKCVAVLTTHERDDLQEADFIADTFEEVEKYIYNN